MNFSEHLPLLLHFSPSLLDNVDDPVSRVPENGKASHIIWDIADFARCYSATNAYLGRIDSSNSSLTVFQSSGF